MQTQQHTNQQTLQRAEKAMAATPAQTLRDKPQVLDLHQLRQVAGGVDSPNKTW